MSFDRDKDDRYWCHEGCGFVDEHHRCEQWCNPTRIPVRAVTLILAEGEVLGGEEDECECCGHDERKDLIAELAIAQGAARVLAHCYDNDIRPPLDSLQYGRKLPVRCPSLNGKVIK